MDELEEGRFDPLRGFRRASVSLGEGGLLFATAGPGLDVEARVRVLDAEDGPFAFAAERVAVGGVPVPGLMVDWVLRRFDPSARIASRIPMPVDVASA